MQKPLPGDLIGVTVVISTRPQQMSTPTPMPELVIDPGYVEPTTQPSRLNWNRRMHEPFLPAACQGSVPDGVRVIAVRGLPQQTESSEDSGSFNLDTQPKMLILLVPNESREVLSLALQQGDRLVVPLDGTW